MDFFKYISVGEPTLLTQGEQINGIDRSTWVERYRTPGEFTFESMLSSGLKDVLPIGTLISHSDSYDIMMVENHEIGENEEEDSTLTITGRSFLAALENRIVGSNQARAGSSIVPYAMTANYSWNQIVSLINDHITTIFSDDNFTDVTSDSVVPGTSVSTARTIEFGTVLERVLELLQLDNLGIKTIRKNTFGVGVSGKTVYRVHGGVDHSSDVFFSWQSGDVSAMNYLFSNKNLKTSAIVKGRYVWAIVDTGPVKYNRRVMLVDGTDIDGNLDTIPTGGTLTSILAAMTTRGHQALMAQNQITINQSDISSTADYRYREDFDIGDLISIGGNFGQIAVMRITEYAEIEDEGVYTGHPTLEIIGA